MSVYVPTVNTKKNCYIKKIQPQQELKISYTNPLGTNETKTRKPQQSNKVKRHTCVRNSKNLTTNPGTPIFSQTVGTEKQVSFRNAKCFRSPASKSRKEVRGWNETKSLWPTSSSTMWEYH